MNSKIILETKKVSADFQLHSFLSDDGTLPAVTDNKKKEDFFCLFFFLQKIATQRLK